LKGEKMKHKRKKKVHPPKLSLKSRSGQSVSEQSLFNSRLVNSSHNNKAERSQRRQNNFRPVTAGCTLVKHVPFFNGFLIFYYECVTRVRPLNTRAGHYLSGPHYNITSDLNHAHFFPFVLFFYRIDFWLWANGSADARRGR